MNTLHQRERIAGRTESQVVQKARLIKASRNQTRAEQGANFGGKKKIRTRFRVIERLDAHGIASHEQAVLTRVPKSEGEHSTELRETGLAPAGVSFQQNFGVRMADELCTSLLKLEANVAEVIDFSVVGDPVAGFWVVHWLMAQRRRIEDGEAAVSQADFDWFRCGVAHDHRAGVVRAAMREGRGAALQHVRGDLGVARDDTEDSTHWNFGRWRFSDSRSY